MEKLYLALLFVSMLIASSVQEAEAITNFPFSAEKVTKLHFYMHETVSSPDATNRAVARASNTFTSPTFFGLVAVLDNPLRTEPNNNSEIVGQMQGLISFTDLNEFSIHMTVDLLFTSGEFNGSTLSVVGRNPYMHDTRELPVVGGSGVFRFARGVFVIRTVSFNTPPNTNFFEINVTVLHRVAHGHGAGGLF